MEISSIPFPASELFCAHANEAWFPRGCVLQFDPPVPVQERRISHLCWPASSCRRVSPLCSWELHIALLLCPGWLPLEQWLPGHGRAISLCFLRKHAKNCSVTWWPEALRPLFGADPQYLCKYSVSLSPFHHTHTILDMLCRACSSSLDVTS